MQNPTDALEAVADAAAVLTYAVSVAPRPDPLRTLPGRA